MTQPNGRQLLLCAVLVAGLALPATAAAQDPTTPAADTIPPVLSAVSLTPALARAATGTVLHFTLSEPARVGGVVQRKRTGVRTKGHRCVARIAHRHGPPCLRRTPAGSFLAASAAAGVNQATLGIARLVPGDYSLTLTPVDVAGNTGAAARVGFHVRVG
ncbi:MAG TPA: hypothetical protein VII98_04930 [Solirubrobacteraceae bacterium]